MSPISIAVRFLAVCLSIVAWSPAASAQDAPQSTQQQQAPLNQGQLDAILAPIGLYPDVLLSKILIASTFPDQVLDADNWQKRHASLKGGALDRAIAGKIWDANVKALTHIPGVLDMMSGQQDWMYQLGGAFVQQQNDVMNSVQRLRRQAQAHGSLKDTSQQRVVQQGDTIVIQPAQPQVVYVPYYNPTIVYGAWAYPAYRPYYWATPYGYGYAPGAFAAGLAWGAGVAISAAIWNNAFDWHGGNVYYGGGWYGQGNWNHGYYNNWHNNNWHGNNNNWRGNNNGHNFNGHNVNIHNNNVNVNGNRRGGAGRNPKGHRQSFNQTNRGNRFNNGAHSFGNQNRRAAGFSRQNRMGARPHGGGHRFH